MPLPWHRCSGPIFRCRRASSGAVEKQCYEQTLNNQMGAGATQIGTPGDLHALLHSGDTWTVE